MGFFMTSQSLVPVFSVGMLLAFLTVPTSMPVCSPASAATAASPAPSLNSCIKCHTDKELLKQIAVDKTVKSEATQGEG
jgi:hypothetical protein